MDEGEEGGLIKLREENEMLRGELEILRKEYTIELIIGSMREEEKEDNKSIAEAYGLATEEKRRQKSMRRTGKAKEIKRK